MSVPYLLAPKAEGLVVDPCLDRTIKASEAFGFRPVVYAGWVKESKTAKNWTLILASSPLHWHVLRQVVMVPDMSFRKAQEHAEKFERGFTEQLNAAAAEAYLKPTTIRVRNDLVVWLSEADIPDTDWGDALAVAQSEVRRRRLGTLLANEKLSIADERNMPKRLGVPDFKSPSCVYFGGAKSAIEDCLQASGYAGKTSVVDILSRITGADRVRPENNTRIDNHTKRLIGYAAGSMALRAHNVGALSIPPAIKRSVHVEIIK